MGVDPDEERTVDPLLLAMQADRLGDGEDVLFVEGACARGPAMPRGPECDFLRGRGGIGSEGVVVRHQSGNVFENRFWCRHAGGRAGFHSVVGGLSFASNTSTAFYR